MAGAKSGVSLLAALVCAACQYSPDMLDRTVAYNRTVADSTNQVLLLNIVRASQRLPTYYTRLEGDAASLGLTPNGSLSLPLSSPRSLENDLTTSAAGAVTSGGSKAISALGNIVSTFGLQASESNVMTLQTLDDQKYQNGMMTPVPVKNIQAFQDEGYERDLLFMMFFSSIAVSQDLIGPIEDGAQTRCGEIPGPQEPANAQDARGVSFARQLCNYISLKPYGSQFYPANANPPADSFSLRKCMATGGAIVESTPKEVVRFNNDPAREALRPGDPHPELCFQILLSDLLILGLEVGSAQDVPAELVDAVPDKLALDPKFRAQMIQQNFFMRQADNNITAICKKKAQDNGFTLAFTDPDPKKLVADTTSLGVLMKRLVGKASEPGADKTVIDPTAACQQKTPGKVEKDSLQTALGTPIATDAGAGAVQPVKLTSDKIAFSTRSFEGMVYYLGEAVRYEETPGADPANFPHVLGRNPNLTGSQYFETMFYSSSRVPDADRALSVRDDNGTAYAVPKDCTSVIPASRKNGISCSAEYPDNESLQVLNFINQIWGLQKESVASPSSPIIAISPP